MLLYLEAYSRRGWGASAGAAAGQPCRRRAALNNQIGAGQTAAAIFFSPPADRNHSRQQTVGNGIGRRGTQIDICVSSAAGVSLLAPPANGAHMSAEELVDLELTLNRFNRLIGEVMRGALARNSFQPWEAAILMDLENCQLERRRRLDILRQYQRAVERQMIAGPGPPMKLSEFLVVRDRRREQTEAI